MMGDKSDIKFNDILSMVKRAQSDNEKLAALLVISKVGESLDTEKRKKLLPLIGLSFPVRLLLTSYTNGSDLNNSEAFASIGANAILILCADEELSNYPEVLTAIPRLLKAAEHFATKNSTKTVIDCIDCLSVLISNEICALQAVEDGIINLLCDIDHITGGKYFGLLVSLLRKYEHLWERECVILHQFLSHKAKDFKNDQTEKKFQLCAELYQVLCTTSTLVEKNDGFVWKIDILLGLQEILCSKVVASQRNPAMMLAAEMLRLFGFCVFFGKNLKDNFPIILIRLASIEIALFLRNFETEEAKKAAESLIKGSCSLYVACCSLIEHFCSSIAQFEQNEDGGEDLLTFEQIQMTQTSLSEVVECISSFVTSQLEKQKLSASFKLCFESSVSVLGSWMSIEHNVSSSQGVEFLPLIVKILKFAVHRKELLLLKYTLPCIPVCMEYSQCQKTMLECDVIQTLKNVLEMTLRSNSEAQEAIQFVMQALISIITQLSSNKSLLGQDILKEYFSIITEIETMSIWTIETTAHLATLAMILLNKLENIEVTPKVKSTVQSMLCFLRKSYDVNAMDKSLKISPLYQDSWDDISHLWKISLENLTESMTKHAWIQTMVQEEEWSKLLSASKRNDKDSDISSLLNLLKVVK